MAGDVTYFAALLAGLISFLSPCVLPLVPPYLCYLAGTSLDQMVGEGQLPPGAQRRAVFTSIVFVLGFTSIFIFLGASASAIGRLLVGHLDILAKVAGGLIILMGLHFVGLFKIPLLYREARYHGEVGAGGYVGAYLMGLAFAFGWTPCVGPVLAAILFVAASEDTIYKGMSLLAVYSLGLGVPFILAAFAMKPFMRFLGRFRKYLGLVEKVMGVLLIAAGIAFMTGAMTDLSFWLLEMFPGLAAIG